MTDSFLELSSQQKVDIVNDEIQDNQIAPFVNLGRRLRDEARGVGLAMDRFFVMPNLDGENHTVTGIFTLDEEMEITNETVGGAIDQAFEELVTDEADRALEEKLNRARENLRNFEESMRDPDKGLGLDD